MQTQATRRLLLLPLFAAVASFANAAATRATELVLEPEMRHLRNAEPREWSEFPAKAEATDLTYTFEVTDAFQPQTLRLRHRDLRRDWILTLDGRELIRLPQGDQDATTFWPLAADRFKPGKHELKIATKDKTPDDVMLGELRLDTRAKTEILGEAKVSFELSEVHPFDRPQAFRLTVVDERGSLMTLEVESGTRHVAVRPGVINCVGTNVSFHLPAGRYTFYVGRGFEYGVSEKQVDLPRDELTLVQMPLRWEVHFHDWAACDTHVHTLTHSGHGDCTAEERLVTLASEGIEYAVATEHNKTVALPKPRFGHYFQVLAGNEVTTNFGHFNVFPLNPAAPVIDHTGTDWAQIGAAIAKGSKHPIVVLNHARDIHKGFRPFDPRRHISIAGEDVEGWVLPANAMEVVNSGSTQSDPWQLFHDWMGLLNRGLWIVPIGASDSHDVARYIVGQGRTYVHRHELVRGDKGEVQDLYGLRTGRVMVGMGLLCSLKINDRAGLDSLAIPDPKNRIAVQVFGPSWVQADEVRLFANGTEIEAVKGPPNGTSEFGGLRCSVEWTLPRFRHDVFLTAIAKGPGVDAPYWPIPKPYQPTSPDWKSYVIGCSGARRVDGDGDGKYSSPYDYAKRLFAESAGDDAKLVVALKDFDEAVAVQTASVARAAGKERFESFLDAVAKQGAPQTKSGAAKYVEGWRATLVGEKK